MAVVRLLRQALAVTALFVLGTLTLDPPQSIASWGAKAYAGSAVIGGRRMSCRFGKVVFNDKLPDLGMAARGTIWLNRKLLRKFSPAFQQFVFLHECAHQYTFDEAEADCWAIKRGVYRKAFSSGNIKQICRVMKNWKGGLWHNTGADRCAGIQRCFKTATSKRKKSKRRSGVSGSQ